MEELAPYIGCQREELSKKWSQRDGFPSKTSHGWDIDAVVKWKAKWERAAALATTGSNADVKRRKLLADAETSEVKLAAMKNELVEFEVMLRYLGQLGQIQQDAFAKAVALVKCRTKNPDVVKIMEDVRNETYKAILDALANIA